MVANLLEYLATTLQADPIVSGIMTGGIYADELPDLATVLPPYLVITEADTNTQGILGGNQWLDHLTLDFEVPSFTRASARQFRDLVRDAVMAPRALGVWPGGRETGRYLAPGQTCELYESLGVTGSDVWIARFSVTFMQARG